MARIDRRTNGVICEQSVTGLPNFVTRYDVRMYKGGAVTDVIDDIENGKIDVPPGWNKRFDRWCYGAMDVLTDERLLLNNSNFVEMKEVLYIRNAKDGSYVPWDDVQKMVQENSPALDDVDAVIIPTHVIKDTVHSQYDFGCFAFEQELVDRGIGWFAYIKFYDDKDGIPRGLVGGKSGSSLVNSSGNDLSFSMDPDDGPARRFLLENDLDWHREHVAVYLCETEKEAYRKERELQKKYGLFGS